MSSIQQPLQPHPDRPSLWVGIDPGQTGALAVLDAKQNLVAASTWQRRPRKTGAIYFCTVWAPDSLQCTEQRRLSQAAGYALRALSEALFEMPHLDVPIGLCVEDIYVGPNPQSALTLAIDAGRFMGVIENEVRRDATWVLARTWRPPVLGKGAGAWKTDKAKEEALRQLPLRVAGLAEALDALGRPHHLAEAAGIAVWDRATWDDRQGRRR